MRKKYTCIGCSSSFPKTVQVVIILTDLIKIGLPFQAQAAFSLAVFLCVWATGNFFPPAILVGEKQLKQQLLSRDQRNVPQVPTVCFQEE